MAAIVNNASKITINMDIFGNASVNDVVLGKTFTSVDGKKITGAYSPSLFPNKTMTMVVSPGGSSAAAAQSEFKRTELYFPDWLLGYSGVRTERSGIRYACMPSYNLKAGTYKCTCVFLKPSTASGSFSIKGDTISETTDTMPQTFSGQLQREIVVGSDQNVGMGVKGSSTSCNYAIIIEKIA